MLLTPRNVGNFEASPPKHQKQVCNYHSSRNCAVNNPRHAPNWVPCAQAGMILDPQLGGAFAVPERAIARSYGRPDTARRPIRRGSIRRELDPERGRTKTQAQSTKRQLAGRLQPAV
jgi:hypothetical protein